MKYSLSLLLVFLISILVRLPYLNRPLSGNYQWLTAHTLITYDIWNQEGIVYHHFLPVYTYPDSVNHHIPIGDLGSVEKNGRLYYVSYPAFGFIFPYIFTLGWAYEPIVLKLFNILLHFVSAIFLWQILIFFFSRAASFLAVVYFLLQPNLLWFHGNSYFLDVLSMDLLILQLYCTLRYLHKPNLSNGIFWLGTNLLLCQTEWIGYLVLFTAGLYGIYEKKWKLLGILWLWGILNLGLTIVHYGSFLGYEPYWNALIQKGLKRVGTSDALSHHWGEWKPFLFFVINFIIYEFTLFIALFFNMGNTLSQIDNLKNTFNVSLYTKLVILAGLPVLLHYILLFNFTTGHSALAAVSANPFLVLLLAPMLEMVVSISSSTAQKIGIIFNVIIIILGVLFFLLRNHYGFQNYFKDYFANFRFAPTNEFQTIGYKIQKSTPRDYIAGLLFPIFIINPQIMLYAKRNVRQFYSYQEAVEYAQKNQVKIKLYEINSFWQVIKVYEVLP
ncbi:MAG: hypothetical protein KatS3mg035_0111 [Bacteroidia bacterium]|nr:MAG: hypothetical protein KatS3mg035_0111 [Bacteroidia bacterium]